MTAAKLMVASLNRRCARVRERVGAAERTITEKTAFQLAGLKGGHPPKFRLTNPKDASRLT